jgi:hypothetical protein
VGDRIVPCHVFASHQWSVKSESSEPNESLIRENMAYIESNPHEAWLRQVFAIAGAGYGRIDYGMFNGAPQTWKINLNPTIGMPATHKRKSLAPELESLREQDREAFHGRLRDAFVALDRDGLGAAIEVALDPGLAARLNADEANRQRRERRLATLRRLYGRPQTGLLVRQLYRRMLPRL